MAARIRDRLAATFGNANVFMDVDNLIGGQRFDKGRRLSARPTCSSP